MQRSIWAVLGAMLLMVGAVLYARSHAPAAPNLAAGAVDARHTIRR
jgi:hypothetical protein